MIKKKGFSILELTITLIIASIFLSTVFPFSSQLWYSLELQFARHNLIHQFKTLRIKSMIKNINTQVAFENTQLKFREQQNTVWAAWQYSSLYENVTYSFTGNNLITFNNNGVATPSKTVIISKAGVEKRFTVNFLSFNNL